MGELNPYAKYLDGRTLEAILSDSPGVIASLLEATGSANASSAPAPGKWSPAEIVAHLADCEIVFAFRLRQTLAEDSPVIQPFDQDKWAAQYSGTGAEQALGVFTALRNWNVQLLARALPAAASRPTTHPERGAMTFLTIVETMAGHDLNHIGQLARIAAPART